MRKLLGFVGGLGLLIMGLLPAQSAQIPLFVGPNCEESSQTLSCFNQLIVQLNQQLAAVPTFATPRNVLDNGAMAIQQRTAAATCATTSALASTAYSADRWACDVNVGSGNFTGTVITTTPAPPLGFQQSIKLVRAGGALTQPGCFWQAVPTAKAVALQGQQVTFSAYEQALAGLAADQGSTTQSFNLVVIIGTTADEGFASWTASPAITPAFTGLATQVNTNFITPVTPSWQRYQVTAAIPTTTKEIAVGACFTPTAAGQSATDGIAVTGLQLEAGSVMTAYEFKDIQQELATAQRYFYILVDNTTSSHVYALGQNTTTSNSTFTIQFPVTMRAAPAVVVSATTAFGDTATAGAAAACTNLTAVASSSTVVASQLNCSAGATVVAGGASNLVGENTAATVTFSADF